jgi:hypothetical protein
MGKKLADVVLDAALDRIATSTIMVACSQEPMTRTQAVVDYKLADVAVSAGDFTKQNGTTSGRKVVVAQKADVTVDTGGTATYVALCDAATVLVASPCNPRVLVQGSTMTFLPWEVELEDPQ